MKLPSNSSQALNAVSSSINLKIFPNYTMFLNINFYDFFFFFFELIYYENSREKNSKKWNRPHEMVYFQFLNKTFLNRNFIICLRATLVNVTEDV